MATQKGERFISACTGARMFTPTNIIRSLINESVCVCRNLITRSESQSKKKELKDRLDVTPSMIRGGGTLSRLECKVKPMPGPNQR